MKLYCGIDLHSNNHVVVVIDADDRKIVDKRLPNDLEATLALLEPLRQGTGSESFTGYHDPNNNPDPPCHCGPPAGSRWAPAQR